jgi:hypothetical protein
MRFLSLACNYEEADHFMRIHAESYYGLEKTLDKLKGKVFKSTLKNLDEEI